MTQKMTPSSPILILPGIGGSILVKAGHEKRRLFKDVIVDNRWMNISPLSHQRMTQWRNDNSSTLVRNPETSVPIGIRQQEPGIRVYPGTAGICNIAPEFEMLARPYQDLLDMQFNYKYFNTFVNAALENGYSRDHNIQAIPYDFRRVLDPAVRADLFMQIKSTVEAMCLEDGPLVIVGHSLGAVLFKWFLSTSVTRKWVKRHIKCFFVVNAPFGGSVVALKALLSGEYYVPIFSKNFHSALQLNSGILMCLPNLYGYTDDEPLATIESERLTLTPKTILEREGDAFDAYRHLYLPFQDCIMDPTSVHAHIVTAAPTLNTVRSFKIGKVGNGDVEDLTFEHGDSQVSARSLSVANDLFDSASTLKTTIEDCQHISLLSDPRFIKLVLDAARL